VHVAFIKAVDVSPFCPIIIVSTTLFFDDDGTVPFLNSLKAYRHSAVPPPKSIEYF